MTHWVSSFYYYRQGWETLDFLVLSFNVSIHPRWFRVLLAVCRAGPALLILTTLVCVAALARRSSRLATFFLGPFGLYPTWSTMLPEPRPSLLSRGSTSFIVLTRNWSLGSLFSSKRLFLNVSGLTWFVWACSAWATTQTPLPLSRSIWAWSLLSWT